MDSFELSSVLIRTAGPKESLESVLAAARHDMHVKVRDALADAIVDGDETAVGLKRGLHRLGQEAGSGEKGRNTIGRQIGEGFKVGPWDKQRVAGKERPGVEEGQNVPGFIYFGSREGSGGDLAENARSDGHGFHDAPGVRRFEQRVL